MIISKTPFRVSFFGGGTDYPDYYKKYGGKVLGTAIDKYAYLIIRKLPPFFDYNYRVTYSKIESVKDIKEIVHPAVRETLKYLDMKCNISITYDADLPARSGIGSSSTFTVGLVKGLYALNGKMITKKELAEKAIHIEQNVLKENVGSQDQTFAAYGGFNIIEFMQNGEIVVSPVIISYEKVKKLEKNLMLFFTGISRFASDIAKKQIESIENNKSKLDKMKLLVDEALHILNNKDVDEFGKLLDYTWNLKRKLSSNISNEVIDTMYEKALKAGALGGKLLGAGGGGFMLFYVPEKYHLKVREALKDYIYVPFNFDYDGSQIIFYKENFSRNGCI